MIIEKTKSKIRDLQYFYNYSRNYLCCLLLAKATSLKALPFVSLLVNALKGEMMLLAFSLRQESK